MKPFPLTIFRLREGVKDPDQIFQRPNQYRLSPIITRDGHDIGMLHVDRSREGEPLWLDFFGTTIDKKELGLRRASSAAVLLVEHDNWMFALTFGYGRYMLEQTAIDESFGLRATLNALDIDHVISLDSRKLDTSSMARREQAGRESAIEEFSLDGDSDLLRSVTGRTTYGEHEIRITGRDSLAIAKRMSLDDVPATIRYWHDMSFGEAYKERFLFIDNTREITKAVEKDKLNEKLIEKLQNGDWENVVLTPPNIEDWSNIAGFRFRSRKAESHSDLTLDNYFQDARRQYETITIQTLKRDPIYAQALDSGHEVDQGKVYRHIYAEIGMGSAVFILSDGRWLEVSRDFLEDLNRFVDEIPETDIELPPYPKEQCEGAYNGNVADSDSTHFTQMDKSFIYFGGGRSKIEVCDLYHSSGVFMHMKRYAGSQTLSHLFTQGEASAEALCGSQGFREQVTDAFPDIDVASEAFAGHGQEVAYVLLGKETPWLPFLARVRLRSNVKQIRPLGFKVTLTPVPFQ